jgi:hypothetical protein
MPVGQNIPTSICTGKRKDAEDVGADPHVSTNQKFIVTYSTFQDPWA